MDMHRDRVISVVLSDEDWKALLRVHPQPVRWIQERIQETIGASRDAAPNAPETLARC